MFLLVYTEISSSVVIAILGIRVKKGTYCIYIPQNKGPGPIL